MGQEGEGPCSSSNSGGSGSLAHVQRMLDEVLRVTTPQGRVITGRLQCLDKQGNLVLSGAQEMLANKAEPRSMGMVLVPPQQQQRVELQVRGARCAHRRRLR